MEKYKCKRCNRSKIRKGFGTTRNTRNKVCKKCCAEAVRRCYAGLSGYKTKAKRRHRERCIERSKFMLEYLKAHPCVDCGEKDPIILQFDHLNPTEKSRDVTGMTNMGYQRIIEEIAQCEVRCANCHVRRTMKQQNSLRWQLLQQEKAEEK